jgi:hypothetical protein
MKTGFNASLDILVAYKIVYSIEPNSLNLFRNSRGSIDNIINIHLLVTIAFRSLDLAR